MADLSLRPHLTVQLAVVGQVPPAGLPGALRPPSAVTLSPAPWASSARAEPCRLPGGVQTKSRLLLFPGWSPPLPGQCDSSHPPACGPSCPGRRIFPQEHCPTAVVPKFPGPPRPRSTGHFLPGALSSKGGMSGREAPGCQVPKGTSGTRN